MKKIVALLNMKGGVGKTTSSINIATGFANKGNKVLLIDLDPQANSTDILMDISTESTTTINDLLEIMENGVSSDTLVPDDEGFTYVDQMLLDPELAEAYPSHIKNLDVIPSRLDLANTEQSIRNSNSAIHNRLLKLIRKLSGSYDYIFIDCAPVINTLTINVLNACDDIIAPIKIDRGAEKGLIMTVKQLLNIAESFDLDITIRPLFTMVPRNNTAKARIDFLKEFKNSTVKPITTTIRYQDKPVSQASYDNKLVINDNKANVGQDYRELVDVLEYEWEK